MFPNSQKNNLFVEETLYQLKKISPGKIKINQRVYKRLSRFEELFGFPFHGERLTQWLLRRIESISYKNSWTVATNQNKGELVLGDRFFSELNLVERLYLLIHEGRHSDDEGHKHVKCPKGFNFISAGQPGMNLENENACDKGKAGAYSYQAAFLFELYAFGIFNQREMGLLYNSSISRIRD